MEIQFDGFAEVICGNTRNPSRNLIRIKSRQHYFEPLKVPSYTHPKSESESVHVLGSMFLVPHILPSSSSGSRSGTLLGSGVSRRTCASGERGTEKTEAKAHIIQIVDKPSQTLASQTWDGILVFVPAEEVDELVVETRRTSVEIAEFLQGIGRGHGDDGRGALRLGGQRSFARCQKPWWAAKEKAN